MRRPVEGIGGRWARDAKTINLNVADKNHIPGLDGLRGIACLYILVGHFLVRNRDAVAPAFVGAFSQYWSGVDLFFVLSGFVIFLSLSRLADRGYGRMQLLGVYATSRAFRILPVYALLLAVYFSLPRLYPSLAQDELFLTSIPNQVYLYFGQSWYMAIWQRSGASFVVPSWSLCAEVFLYALSFVVIGMASNRNRIKAMLTLVAVSYAARLYVVFMTDNYMAASLLPVCRMDGFMIGGIIALMSTEQKLGRIMSLTRWPFLAIMLGVFVALSTYSPHYAGSFSILFSYAFYAIFYSAILLTIVTRNIPFLSRGPMKFVGTISYFIYLFHFAIVIWMKRISDSLHWGVTLNFLVTLSVTIAAASVSWYLMERPLIALGKSLNRTARST